MCQLDGLQRLKSDLCIVQKALQNLPKTLFETYDKLLLRIPDYERLFVYHALHWLSFHIDLHYTPLPVAFIIEATKNTTARLYPAQNGVYYDIETLREFCGCLIEIQAASSGTEVVVKFSHYTVREYLNSPRLSSKLRALFPDMEEPPASGNLLRQHFIKMLLTEAHCLDSGNTSASFKKDLPTCYAVSALLSLRIFQDDIVHSDSLVMQATSLLDPSRPHFGSLKIAVSNENNQPYFY